MSKIIDSLVQASLDSNNFTGVVLVKLGFTPTQRYCSATQNVYWDEGLPSPEAGEQEYMGLGGLASMSVLNETTELSAQTIQLTLSGIPNNIITDVFSDEYIGKTVYIWYATLDPETYAVEGGQSGPVLLFAGRMDFADVEFGDSASITINATSRLADWERPRGGRFNHVYQVRHVDPTDLGFKYVEALQDKTFTWGAATLIDRDGPGSRPGGGGGNGGTWIN
jgi:hypothetical protein